MNNINLDDYKTDYNNCMRAEDMISKYNINEYYFKKLKKILNLNRGNIGKLDYVLKNNNIIYEEPVKPNQEPIKPKKAVKHTKSILNTNTDKNAKVNINIKAINTDDEINITEIKKCDTTYNNDKSELIKMLNKTDETLKKSKQVLNKKK